MLSIVLVFEPNKFLLLHIACNSFSLGYISLSQVIDYWQYWLGDKNNIKSAQKPAAKQKIHEFSIRNLVFLIWSSLENLRNTNCSQQQHPATNTNSLKEGTSGCRNVNKLVN